MVCFIPLFYLSPQQNDEHRHPQERKFGPLWGKKSKSLAGFVMQPVSWAGAGAGGLLSKLGEDREQNTTRDLLSTEAASAGGVLLGQVEVKANRISAILSDSRQWCLVTSELFTCH